MKLADSAIVLAGGRSSRMGYDKSELVVDGRRLIEKITESLREMFTQVVVVSNAPGFSVPAGCLLVSDELPGFGPLAGIHAGLKATQSRFGLVTACDMPNLNLEYVRFLKEELSARKGPITVLATQYGGHMEPFTAFYRRDLVCAIEDYCNSGGRGLHAFLQNQGVTLIPESAARRFSPDWSMFANLNTPEQYNEYVRGRR